MAAMPGFSPCHPEMAGCLMPMNCNVSHITLEYCIGFGGYLTKNLFCDPHRTAFCANLNQTKYLPIAEESGLGPPQCWLGAGAGLRLQRSQMAFLLFTMALLVFRSL